MIPISKIKTITKEYSTDLDNEVNEYISKGWILLNNYSINRYNNDYSYFVATMGMPIKEENKKVEI